MSELNLSCPSCNRDYELPRRYKVKADDYDYKPLPRLLSCLHTACHSCLEDQRQRNGNGLVICPLCRTEDTVKGIDYLPLDISIMKEVVRTNSSQCVSMCSRCYDDVPSFSWCYTCSAALCEFHHQDHVLSAETSKNHNICTFREIRHQNRHIDYKFPPIACPEVLMQDCSIYCYDCLHLVSAQGMIQGHKGHQVDEYKETIPTMTETVHESVEQCRSNCTVLQKRIQETQEKLQQLDDNEGASLAEINRVFNMLKKKLMNRENELLNRLGAIVEEKRQILTSQLSVLSEMFDDNNHVAMLADDLLRDTAHSDGDRMYLVAATETVEFRSDTLSEVMEQKITQLIDVNSDVSVHFVAEEALVFKALAKSFGGIVYRADKEPSESRLTDLEGSISECKNTEKAFIDYGAGASLKEIDSEERLKQGINGGNVPSTYSLLPSNTNSQDSIKQDNGELKQSHDAAKDDTSPLPKIRFCVRVKHDPKASKGAQTKHLPHCNEYLVVEARLISEDCNDDTQQQGSNTRSSNNSDRSKQEDASEDTGQQNSNNSVGKLRKAFSVKRSQQESVTQVNPVAGTLLGSVIVHTDIDRRLINRHELRSYFESMHDSRGLPMLKVIKEFIAIS